MAVVRRVRTPAQQTLVVVALAALTAAGGQSALNSPAPAHAAVLTAPELGGSERTPNSEGNAELGGSDRNEDSRTSAPAPRPESPPQPAPPVPQDPAPEGPPRYESVPAPPRGNAGSSDPIPTQEGEGWLPQDGGPGSAALRHVDALTNSESTNTADAAGTADPTDGAGVAPDEATGAADSAMSSTARLQPAVVWIGSTIGAAAMAALLVFGIATLRARRNP